MVPPSSQRVSRVRWYSGSSSRRVLFAYGAITLCRRSSQSVRLFLRLLNAVLTPERLLLPVWPLPRSLATTSGISVDFFSSPYLDVSVQAVPLIYLFIQYMMHGRHPCGLLHSDIFGSKRACRSPKLFAAYRVLHRLLMPRHSPYALISLNTNSQNYVLFSKISLNLGEV